MPTIFIIIHFSCPKKSWSKISLLIKNLYGTYPTRRRVIRRHYVCNLLSNILLLNLDGHIMKKTNNKNDINALKTTNFSQFNYLAIQLLEQIGMTTPSQHCIDIIENMISLCGVQ